MSVAYFCDVCKKKTKEIVIVMAGSLEKSPYKHICPECWHKVEKFLKDKLAKPKILLS